MQEEEKPKSPIEFEIIDYLTKLHTFFSALNDKELSQQDIEEFNDDIEISQQEKDQYLQYFVSSKNAQFIEEVFGKVQKIVNQLIRSQHKIPSDFTDFLIELNTELIKKRPDRLSELMKKF